MLRTYRYCIYTVYEYILFFDWFVYSSRFWICFFPNLFVTFKKNCFGGLVWVLVIVFVFCLLVCEDFFLIAHVCFVIFLFHFSFSFFHFFSFTFSFICLRTVPCLFLYSLISSFVYLLHVCFIYLHVLISLFGYFISFFT